MPDHRRKHAVIVPKHFDCPVYHVEVMIGYIYEETFSRVFIQAESHCKSRMKIQNPFTKVLANKGNNDILFQPVDLAKK
jgi:hypothetical protein